MGDEMDDLPILGTVIASGFIHDVRLPTWDG